MYFAILMKKNKSIGTVGMGLMGTSITACLLAWGHEVVAVSTDLYLEPVLRSNIFSFLDQLAGEGKLSDSPATLMNHLIITDDLSKLQGIGLVVECITEDIAEKQQLFTQLERLLARDAIIASNTSAIPISQLQFGMKYPGRLLGLHWAEPAHISKFMEVICGDHSELQYADELMSLATSWGKEPALVRKDIRGFISNRMMYAMIREGLSLVEQGYATVEDIDRACRNDLGQWMTFAGPFRFMDLTGLSAYLKVMEDLFPELSQAEQVPEFMKKLVSQGHNGLSTGAGFYTYTAETAANWERLFMKFSLEIRRLSDVYPQDVGDRLNHD